MNDSYPLSVLARVKGLDSHRTIVPLNAYLGWGFCLVLVGLEGVFQTLMYLYFHSIHQASETQQSFSMW
jgi:hypothetical protein